MIEHVYERSKLFKKWENLFLTTCDNEIKKFCLSKNIPVVMTSKKHKKDVLIEFMKQHQK